MAWAPDYVTVPVAREYITRHTETVDDVQIALAVTAASRAVDEHCNRQFGQVTPAQERRYTATYDYERRRWVVDIDDLQDDTDLVVTVDGEAVTDYTLEPVNAVLDGKAWTRLVVSCDSAVQPTGADNEVAATAPWGWSAVPAQVELATLLQSNRLASRRESPFGIAGSPDTGSELRLLARVDPDVAVSLRGLVRPRKVG
jgi:hypothetical protein